ncbi:ATP-binding cassette domain-containing protein [Nocardia sp. NBC_00508]|uniref:ABC transporter ATP-binding protein n=1 Tax=Nocardia sp. NBC_00508 TaxID=2975992 RepID=UPI002E80CC93|nr:ATP-binding cassette domain-containing protein [Nocardia sp. NBC_00508]WUD64115.1 ATP-binding cassette domain-containing protein [Nocardia sp. NBC_00508]
MSDPVLVDGLTVLGSNGQELAGPTTFRIPAGTVTALTGPSGSGKTTLMRALLGHLPSAAARATGSASVAGRDVLTLKQDALQRFRRQHIAFVGQDPGSALNPLLRVRALLREVAPNASKATLTDALALVGLSPEYLHRRPGELSGGQQRRVALARALVRRTGVLVLDEPLAGLHGALRTDIAGRLVELARERSAAILLSGHDTALVHSIADDVVELGAVHPTLVPVRPAQPLRNGNGTPTKTSGAVAVASRQASGTAPAVLLDAADLDARDGAGAVARRDITSPEDHVSAVPEGRVEGTGNGHQPSSDSGSDDQPVLDIVLRARGISASVDGNQVLAGIDLALDAGAALAVVGASGAGKTTLARVVAGLHHGATGSLELRGKPITVGVGRRIRYGPGGIQLVTQNPRSALNPRRTVAQTLGRPLRRIGRVPRRDLPRRIAELLASVELSADLAARYPHELSGGQRQRVALARALAAEPAVLLCDEITSALDHATAAAIMALLDRIRAESGTALLVITHDMALVDEYCPRLLVLDHGRIVESGYTRTVLAAPRHTATSELLV